MARIETRLSGGAPWRSAAAAWLFVALVLPQGFAADDSLVFDSKRVLDLSGALTERSRLKFTKRPVSIETVNRQTGSVASVLEKAEVSRGDPGVMVAGASKKDEARRISARRGSVSR